MMKSNLPAPPALSLQQKLDRIARERDILALQRDLAQRGLRDGDLVLAVNGGGRGRVLIARDESPPRLKVLRDDGSFSEYSPALWRRA